MFGVGFHQNSISGTLQIWRNVLASSVMFLGALCVALAPEAFDRPVTRLLNSFASRSALSDGLVASLDACYSFSGVVLMALIWSCWFETREIESRTRILIGTLAALGAGGVSRFLQHTLPTHPRPLHDPALSFHPPSGIVALYNTWNSFPSDHVTVFAGLVVVIYIVRPSLAIFAGVWIVLVETSRTYMGGHYPSDLVGGAALGALVVWATQAPWLISFGSRVVLRWGRSSPSLFYAIAFFVSYQTATLFVDIRYLFSTIHIW